MAYLFSYTRQLLDELICIDSVAVNRYLCGVHD